MAHGFGRSKQTTHTGQILGQAASLYCRRQPCCATPAQPQEINQPVVFEGRVCFEAALGLLITHSRQTLYSQTVKLSAEREGSKGMAAEACTASCTHRQVSLHGQQTQLVECTEGHRAQPSTAHHNSTQHSTGHAGLLKQQWLLRIPAHTTASTPAHNPSHATASTPCGVQATATPWQWLSSYNTTYHQTNQGAPVTTVSKQLPLGT